MVQIQSSVDINAPLEKVWNIISDLDAEPKFWKGTKEVKNISKQGNIVTREVTIAFKDSKCVQTVSIFPKEKIQAEFTKGVINGTKTITIIPKNGTIRLEAVWDMKLSGMMSMFTGMVKKHIQSGTEQALQSIKQEAEK